MTRQVLVDAEVLERLVGAAADMSDEQGRQFCAGCGEWGGRHLYDCPVPALQAALTTPPILAQAHADQQARLQALVGTWRGHIAWLEDEGDTGERHQAFTECADELKAVLGGKE